MANSHPGVDRFYHTQNAFDDWQWAPWSGPMVQCPIPLQDGLIFRLIPIKATSGVPL